MARKLEVEIIGDARSFEKALGKASDQSNRFGKTLGNLAKAGAFAAGAAGVGAVFVTLRAGISEFTETTKVAAQTNAVLKSTGSVANVTAGEVEALGDEILRYSGIDDEAIKSGENLLLTFTNIRNEVGKGNDIFNQTTKAVADMSVALGKDFPASAKLLGKALNDPVRGMAQLRRVGVSLTEAQEKQVKAFVASGKTMAAQKVILGELEERFGGSAKAAGDTLPGQLNKLRETFNNLAGDLVAKAVPAVSSFVGFIAEKGLPKLEQFFGAITEAIGPAMQNLGETFKSAGPAIIGVLEPLGEAVRDKLLPIFERLQEIGTEAIERISAVIKQNGPELRRIFENLGTVISNIAKTVIPLLDFAFTKILPVAIRILIPLLVLTTEAMAKITTVTRLVAQVIQGVLVAAFNAAVAVARALQNFYTDKLAPVFGVVGSAAKTLANIITEVLKPPFIALREVIETVRGIFQWYANNVASMWTKIGKTLPKALELIIAPFERLWAVIAGIVGAMKQFIDKAGEVIDLAKKVTGAIGGVIGKIPGLQHGGVAEKGRAYVVGESGPEMFVPGVTGTVIPNLFEPKAIPMPAAPGGGGMTMGVTLNFYGPAVGTSREFEETVRRALYDVTRRNPGLPIGV
jgi:hypothetical protein